MEKKKKKETRGGEGKDEAKKEKKSEGVKTAKDSPTARSRLPKQRAPVQVNTQRSLIGELPDGDLDKINRKMKHLTVLYNKTVPKVNELISSRNIRIINTIDQSAVLQRVLNELGQVEGFINKNQIVASLIDNECDKHLAKMQTLMSAVNDLERKVADYKKRNRPSS